ncbi:MAG: MerR family transcriptional regulator [Desulfovibrio sp.]|nr:MerR family transcriptional regulator [Desulfovibrio sp.]
MPESRSGTYKIGEVAEMLNLKTYVLRFWETEFPQLTPLRTQKGQRLYTDEHVALLRRIQQLLHEQGMTIEGARRILQGSADPSPSEEASAESDAGFLRMLKEELLTIRQMLFRE